MLRHQPQGQGTYKSFTIDTAIFFMNDLHSVQHKEKDHRYKMAAPKGLDILSIKVLEDDFESAVFVVQIKCHNPVLLAYWQRKMFFYNGQVQQTDTICSETMDSMEFVLRVLHRSDRLSNSDYWSPFIIAICLDALYFNYQLPSHLVWNGNIKQVMKENTLFMTR